MIGQAQTAFTTRSDQSRDSVTIQKLNEDVVRSVQHTVEGLQKHHTEILLQRFYSKLVNSVRRIRYTNPEELGKQVQESVMCNLIEFRKQAVQERDEAEWRIRKRILQDRDLKGKSSKCQYAELWSELDKVTDPEQRARQAQIKVSDVAKAIYRDKNAVDGSSRRLTVHWVKESLDAALATKEFCPTSISGHTGSSAETIVTPSRFDALPLL